jgi:Uma2 family endonuclease
MSTVAAKPRYTPEDLLAMPDGDRYELVNGELVERDMGWMSGVIGGQLQGFLWAFNRANRLGWLASGESSYQCFPDAPNRVRKPDVSFIRKERLPSAEVPQGHCPIVPDLVAEVVSPNDFYYEVEVKVDEYLRAGVRLVWVLNPATRSVRVHRADGTVTDLDESGELSGEDVVPGFRCPVSDLFATSPEMTPPS